MPAVLKEGFGGSTVEIPDDFAASINQSVKTLRMLLRIEELFGIFAETILAMEQHLLLAPIKYTLGSHIARDSEDTDFLFDEHRNTLNLLSLTIFNAHQAYLDQSKRLLSSHNQDEILDYFNTQISQAFDTSLPYRIFCALRNFSTHRMLPIHGISFGIHNERKDQREYEGPSRGMIGFNAYFSASEIVADSKVRSETKRDIEALEKERLDLKAVMRGATSAFAKAHSDFADSTTGLVEEAVPVLAEAYDAVSIVKAGGDAKSIRLILDSDNQADEVFLNPRLPTQLAAARTRWRGLKYIHRKYVSGEIVSEARTYFGDVGEVLVTK